MSPSCLLVYRRWALLLACSLAGAVTAGPTATLTTDQARTLGIRTAPLQAGTSAGSLRLQGQVVLPPSLQQVLSAPLAAAVEQVLVARGDTVRSGQALVVLNAPQLVEWQREYQQARLQSELADQAASRDAALLAEGLIPASRALASRNQAQIAQATLKERGVLLQQAGAQPDASLSGRARIAAPAAASVTELLVQPGQRVEAGSPLLKIARRGPLWVELQAATDVARQLHVGDTVRIAGCTEPARLTVLGTQIDPASQMQTLRAAWQAATDCVLPQQRVEAEIRPAAGSVPAWRVPAEAVIQHQGRDWVFVQRGDRYEAVAVQVLGAAASGGEVLVRPRDAGTLAGGAAIVVQGTAALKGQLQGLGAQ